MKVIYKSHFGIYACVLKNHSILLIRKSRGPYREKLDLPGGKPEHGETPEQTIKREILEETGVVVNKVKIFQNYATIALQTLDTVNVQENIHHIGMVYLVTDCDDSGLIEKMDTEDSLGAQWYELSSLNTDDLSPFALCVIKDIEKNHLTSLGNLY